MASLFGFGKSAEEKFWAWFVKHEFTLYNFEQDQVRIFDLLARELRKVQEDLTFEFGQKEPQRDFVISAGGMKAAFPAVVALAKMAPALKRWKVTAFRPRRNFVTTQMQLGDTVFQTNEITFTLVDHGATAGIYIFLPNFREGDMALMQIGYLLLDHYLGEYEVETSLGLIKLLDTSDTMPGTRHPMSDLPQLFDQLQGQLTPRTRLQH